MNGLARDLDWRMTVLFLLFLAVLVLVMKFATLLVPRRSTKTRPRFWFTPLPSPDSIRRSRPLGDLGKLLVHWPLLAGMLALYYWAFWSIIPSLDLPAFLLGYVATPALVLVGPVFHSVVALLWLPSGRLLPSLHDRPLLARSVAEFWGRRWNLWFSDWFRHVLFAPLRRRPALAVILVFFVSGLMHEWVINLPLYLLTGRNLFGTMMIYFLLQAPGVWLERRFLKGHDLASVLFVWLVVFAPVPLVLNEGLLRALQLWPR